MLNKVTKAGAGHEFEPLLRTLHTKQEQRQAAGEGEAIEDSHRSKSHGPGGE